jgi:hypothetical protein
MDTYFKREPPKKPGNGTFPGESILVLPTFLLIFNPQRKKFDHEKPINRL